MSGGHYSREELENFLDPKFDKEEEQKIQEHLRECKECSVLVVEIREKGWNEVRKKGVGF